MTLPPERAPAAWILAPASAAPVEIWGLTPVERLRRALVRAGCGPIRVLEGAADPAPGEPGGLLFRSDWIYDERLVEALAEPGGEPVALVEPAAGTAVAARVGADRLAGAAARLRDGRVPETALALGPGELAPAYSSKLRKWDPPFLLRAEPDRVREIETRTFAASYKGATDLVTKWVWPAPARAVTRRLAAARVHPNTITLISWALAIASFLCFVRGAFGIGLLAAWAMTFLDTVDGKLARVTLTSSRIGDVLDHGLDLVHPPFWWWAWGAGLGWETHPATLVVVLGYFAGRALEGAFLASFGLETHSWRPVDTLFRTITARRNPNLLLLSVGTLAGRPDLGLVMVALWTLASLGFHGVRLLQAYARRARGETITPWDTGSAEIG